MEEAIKAESSSIGIISTVHKDTAIAIMTILIGELVLFFNVGKTMGVAQIRATIDMLLKDITTKNLKPEDYKVMFEDMKKGYYGNLYDRFDGQIIFKIACEYADKRASFIENESIRLASIHKEKGSEIPSGLLTAYNEIKKNIKEDTKTKVNKKFEPRFSESSKILAEFDQLWKEKPVKTGNGRFIEYEGKIVDQIEYLEIRSGLK